MSKQFSILPICALLSIAASGSTVLDTGVTTLTASDPTKSGRLNGANPPSDWSTSKSYPGIASVGTLFRYRVITYRTISPFTQILFDDPDGVFSLSAYTGSLNPAMQDVNYAGDEGATGNRFQNPGYFQIAAATGTMLVLVVSETASSAGLGHPFQLKVEAFNDVDYTDVSFVGGDVSEIVSVTTSGFGRNRATGLWVATLTVTNRGSLPILGPVQVIISNLSPGVTMSNNTGLTGIQTTPYITVASGNLAPGASASVAITFSNASGGYIEFIPITRGNGGL